MATLSQRINFFQEQFHKPVIRLPLSQLLATLLVVTVIMAVVTTLDVLRTKQLSQSLNKMQASRTEMEASITKLQQVVDAIVLDEKRVSQEQNLRTGLQTKNLFLQSIKSQGNTHQVHFSKYLQALADLDVPNVWLTQIKVQSPGPNLRLSGVTQKARSIPQYLKSLNTQSSFDGMGFKVFDLERHEESARYLNFTVATQHDEATQ